MSKMLLRRMLCLAGLLCGLLQAGWTAPASLPPKALGTYWYALHLLGRRSGWSVQTLRQTPTGFESEEQTVLQVALGGQKLTSARHERRCYDEGLRLLSLEHEADQLGRRVRVTGQREGEKWKMQRVGPEGETTREWPIAEDFGRELALLEALAQGRIAPGWELKFRTFDADLGGIDEITVRAVERCAQPEPGWILEVRSETLKTTSRTWLSDEGVLLRQEMPEMMGLAMERVSREEALAELEPFLLASSVPVAQALGRPEQLRRVRLEIRQGGTGVPALFAATARQSVTLEGERVILDVRAGKAPARSVARPISAAELQPYLQPSELLQSADPRLRQQAEEIIAGERDAWAAARLLMRWVYRVMTKVASEPRPLSALEILQLKRGDCTEHAVLMAGLAQAAGLPVRLVAGLAYSDKAYHYHAWNELYVGEWVEMDPTWGEETVDAGHIVIAASALDSVSLARLSLAASRTMGGLQLNVLDYEVEQ